MEYHVVHVDRVHVSQLVVHPHKDEVIGVSICSSPDRVKSEIFKLVPVHVAQGSTCQSPNNDSIHLFENNDWE